MLDKGGGQGYRVLTVNVGCQESVVDPADYGRWRDSRLGSLTEFIEQRVISRLCGNLSGRRVLDRAVCGDGTDALRASREGASAVGLDISPAMLRASRIRATAHATQVRWCQASIAALPFAANATTHSETDLENALVVSSNSFCWNWEVTSPSFARQKRLWIGTQ